jgi:hypothetical protein
MKDVCRLQKDHEALDTLRWAARALLRSALGEAAGRKKRRATRPT